jgi:hypothetical protein
LARTELDYDGYRDEAESLIETLATERAHKDFLASQLEELKAAQADDRKTRLRASPAVPVDSDRVVNALQRNPALLFDVAKRLVGARVLGPWEQNKYSGKWSRQTIHGKTKCEVEKLASSGFRLTKREGGFVNKVAEVSDTKALSDYLWQQAGWVLLEPVMADGFAYTVAAKTHGQWELYDLDDGTMLGSVILSRHHTPQGNYNKVRWSVLQSTDDSGNGECMSTRAAFIEAATALHRRGWTLLGEDVSGLPT